MRAELEAVRRSVALTDEMEDLARRAGRFLQGLAGTYEDVEVWIERRSRWGFRFENRRLIPQLHLGLDRVGFRVLRKGLLGTASCTRIPADDALWRTCVERAAAAARTPAPGGFAGPKTRRPGPMTFDPDLADYLAPARELHRIADALCDNTFHEAERTPGLVSFGGELTYSVRRYVVANKGGVVASLHGDLSAAVEFNSIYGDRFHQVHAPESFQPLALLGARTLRNLPEERATPADLGLRGRIPVVLHPRVLEALLRKLATPLLTTPSRRAGLLPFAEGERIAHESVTLIDDGALDGLASSRGFDDEGSPTRRNALIVRGRLAQLLQTRAHAAEHGGPVTGSGYRRPLGAEDPQDAPIREAPSSLLMERGELGFHEMIAGVEKAILVHELLSLHSADLGRSRFSCGVGSGMTLERNRNSRLLAPGTWSVSGNLFSMPGEPRGALDDVVFSKELYDTGTAILPYCLTFLTL